MDYEVLSPWADIDEQSIENPTPRISSVDDKTIGLFSFFKEHGPLILEEVGRQLKARFPGTTFTHFQYPKDCVDIADDEDYANRLLKWLAGVDAVVCGHGDATSCALFLSYNTAFIEKQGKPTVLMLHKHFENIARSGSSSRGIREMRIVKTEIKDMSSLESLDGIIESLVRPEIAKVVDAIFEALVTPVATEARSAKKPSRECRKVVFKGNLTEVNRYFYKKGWTTGAPIMPPTEEAVKEMLTGTDLPPDTVIGTLPPMSGKATVETIAINAVMAGCLPTYMPVLIAAVKALTDYPKLKPGVALEGYTCSVASWAPLLIINGPIRDDLNVNSGIAAFSPYYIANTTIGRALGLILMNIGGLHPAKEDMSSIGHEGRNGMCIAENEALSPWEPLNIGKGMTEGDSTVTLFWPNSRTLIRCGNDAPGILRSICDKIDTFGFNPGCGIFMGPTTAKVLHDYGFSKKDLLAYILEYARKPAGNINLRFIKGNHHIPETVPLAIEPTRSMRRIYDPNNLLIVVVGEAYHRHVALYGGGGDHGGPITRKIEVTQKWKNLVLRYKDLTPSYTHY